MVFHKPVFNINDFDGTHVMHCKNEDEAMIFFEYLNSVGERYMSGTPYVGKKAHPYDPHMSYYRFRAGTYDTRHTYSDKRFTIIEFDDFDWSSRRKCETTVSLTYDELFN